MHFVLINLTRMILALGIAFYFQYGYFSDGYWLILSAFFGIYLQNNFYYRHPNVVLLLLTMIVSILVVVATIFSYNLYISALFLMLLTYFCFSFAIENKKYWLHALVIVLYAILANVLLTNFNGAIIRFGSIWSGFLIAIIVRNLLFISDNDKKMFAIKQFIEVSDEYLQGILLALIRRDYAANVEFYEISFHDCRQKLNKLLLTLHNLINVVNDHDEKIEIHLHKFYENILALHNILLRIEDPAIFEMAHKEFIAMRDNIKNINHALANFERPIKLDEFAYTISQLQEVQQSGVELVAKNPMLFYLFIEDWKLLERRYELLANLLVEKQ